MSLSCNVCHKRPDGIAYRTACNHYFCPQCAHNTFVESNECPLCSTLLGKEEVIEMNVGVGDISSAEMVNGLFSNILQSNRLDSVVTNLNDSYSSISLANEFVMKQLLTSINTAESNNTLLSAKLDSEAQEYAISLRELRQEMSTKEVLLSECTDEVQLLKVRVQELKEAYKEKDRKCNAWEVAYNSIREQLNTGASASSRSKTSKPTQPPSSQPAPLSSTGSSRSSPSSHYNSSRSNSSHYSTPDTYEGPLGSPQNIHASYRSNSSRRLLSKANTSSKRAGNTNVDNRQAKYHHDMLSAQKKVSVERCEETQASWRSYSEAALYRPQSDQPDGPVRAASATAEPFPMSFSTPGGSGPLPGGFFRSGGGGQKGESRWFHAT